MNIHSKVIAIFYDQLLVIQSDLSVYHLAGYSVVSMHRKYHFFLNIEIASCHYQPPFPSIFSKLLNEELKKNVILLEKGTHPETSRSVDFRYLKKCPEEC